MWAGRALCAAALTAAVAVGLAQRQPAESVPQGVNLCTALQVVANPALYDRVPPPDASPEMEKFVTQLNVEIALVRRQIEEACRG